jgi:hypothetical protein
MAERDARVLAAGGVVGTAVLATLLLAPAIRRLGRPDEFWLSAAIMVAPTAALLTATGFAHYGLLRSLAVALVIMVLTTAIIWVIAVFTFATALSGYAVGTVMGVVLVAVPAVLVVALGLLALRIVPARARAAPPDREPAARR